MLKINTIKSPSQREIIRHLNIMANKIKNKKILDVGCGTGLYTQLFCKNNNEVFGLDLQNNLRIKNVKFIKGNALNMPFPQEFFDVVISFDVIEHIDDDNLFLKECWRVLKDNGMLILGTPNRNRISFFILSLLGKKPNFPRKLGKDPILGEIIHIREYTTSELEDLLKINKFRIKNKSMIWLGFSVPFFKKEIGIKDFPCFLNHFALYILFYAKKEK
ncbi:MAG: class I SAM-dependent methyltransferase [Microgenomates group bacterium]